jgi:tRNA-Thr(GGU) m(6)t(6)A37 methyltransferase TsaA
MVNAMNTAGTIIYTPIGRLETPFQAPGDAPIQPAGARGVRGRALLNDEYAEALPDLAGFSHVILLYHCDRAGGFSPRVTPFLADEPKSLFATRAPARPNPIGLSVVKLIAVEGTTLVLEDVDMLDGTPLLDVKPYVAEFDAPDADRFGWIEAAAGRAASMHGDDRFTTPGKATEED